MRAYRRISAIATATACLVAGLAVPAFADPAEPVLAGLPLGDEIVAMRTRYAKTYPGQAAGTFQSVIHAKPIHYQDADGAWRDIDNTLVAAAGGGFRNAAGDLGVKVTPLAADGAKFLHLDLGDGLSLGFGLSGALPAYAALPVGNQISLPDVLDGISVDLTTRENGVKEDLVLASPDSASEFSFPLYLHGLTASVDDEGNVLYRDLNGVERARTPHGYMTDSKVDPRSGDPAMSDGVTFSIEQSGPTGTALRVSADRAWLNDPARQYPVRIDPTVYTAGSDDTYVEYPYNNDFSTDTLLKSGTYDGGAHKARSFIHFDGANALDGKVISAATVQVYENWAYSCSARDVNLMRVTQAWSGAGLHAWPGWSVSGVIDTVSVARGYTGCVNGPAYVNFDATTAMANWASNTWANYGVALVAASETDSYGWKKWDSTQAANDPRLSVTWSEPNRAPGRPAGRAVGGNVCSPCTQPITADTTPALTGNTTDADGDTLKYFFEVYSGWLTATDSGGGAYVSGQTAVASGSTAYVASGTTATWTTTPALADGKYSYRVRAYDAAVYGGWSSGWVNYTIDSTAPTPAVSSSTHPSQTAWSAANDPSFAWTATSESGVKGYSYVLDQASATVPDTVSEGTAASKAYTDVADGVWYFHVRAQNNANIWGATAHYAVRVDVTAPAAPDGLTSDHTPNVLSTNPAVGVGWNAVTDGSSGTAGYSYEFNSSQTAAADGVADTTATSANSGTLADGTWWFHVRAVDTAGNAGPDRAYGPFLINAAVPAPPVITSATSSAEWTSSRDVRFDWTAPSDVFGIAGYAVAFNQDPSTTLTSAVTTSGLTDIRTGVADGVWYLHVAAVNNAGTVGATATYRVLIDATVPAAPALTSSTHPVQSTWYPASTAQVTASATAVSGLAGYAVSIDQDPAGSPGTAVTTTSATSTFSNLADGTWYVHVRAVSGSRLVSATTTYTLRIDAAAVAGPVVSASAPSASWTPNRSVTFSWPPPASVSGIAGYALAFTQDPATVLPKAVSTTATTTTRSGITDGVWYLHVAAANNAGTWSPRVSYKVMVDGTTPAAPALSSSSHPSQAAWSSAATGSVTAVASAVSGIAGYAFSLDQSLTGDPGQSVTSTAGTRSFSGLADGIWYLHARAVSGSGLVSPVKTYTLNIDTAAPTAPAVTSETHEPGVTTKHRVVTIGWADAPSTDATSGVAGYSVAVNASDTTPADPTVDVTGTTFTSASLSDGTYWFHVRPLDLAGNPGADVTFGPVVIHATAGLPYPVPDVVATAGDTTATVTWSPVDDNGSAVLGYSVTAEPGGTTVEVGPTALTATFTGLENDTAYAFTVTARNANGAGNPSEPSVDVVPAGAVGAPTDVQAEELPNANAVRVTWVTPELDGNANAAFDVVLNPGNITRTVEYAPEEGEDETGMLEDSNATTFTGLAPGTYTAQVIAKGDNGTTEASQASEPVVVQGRPPATPTQLVAVPGDEEVTLTWAAPADNGSPITQYEVVNQADGSTQYVEAPETSVVMTGLSNATTYVFDVYATNELGRGDGFARASATPVDTGVYTASDPLAPSNVKARRGDRSVSATWTAPTVSAPGVTGYQLTAYRRSDHAQVGSGTSMTTSGTVTGLTNGVKVYVKVATLAGPAAGPESNKSNDVTPAGRPFPPTSMAAALRGVDGDVRLTWRAPNANGDPIRHYLVQTYSSSGTYLGERKTGASPQTIRGLSFGSTYYFTVKAVNGVGTGNASAPSNDVTVRGAPTAPGNVTGSQYTPTAMRATWTAATPRGAAVTKYVVTAEPSGKSVTTAADATSAVISGLKRGQRYRLHVAAYSVIGRGRPGVTGWVTLKDVPGAPSNVKATPGAGKITVSWSAANPHGARVLDYTIYSDGFSLVKTVGGDKRSWTFTGLAGGSTYRFNVWASNSEGNGPSAASNTATVGSADPPPAPSKPSPGNTGGGSFSGAVGTRIAKRAQSQDQYHAKEREWPAGGNCNWYTGYWGRGTTRGQGGSNSKPCENDPHPPAQPATTRAQYWCSDFAQWVWKQEGVNTSGMNGLASSFMPWAQNHGTWHAAGSGYTPRVGDAAVWKYDTSSSGHVAIVVKVESDGDIWTVNGNAGPDNDGVGNIDVWYKRNPYLGSSKYYSGRGRFRGFASPVDSQGRAIK